jgi:NADPH2:quinone reductase
MEGGREVKAIVVSEKGGPEKLVLREVDDPSPGQGELLVEINAAGLNFIDTYHRGGLYPMDFPMTPGLEGAGIVRAAGSDVDGFSEGDRVAWVNAMGSYAELNIVPAQSAIPVPDDVSDDEAAAVLLQGITAHYLAKDTFSLSSDHRCLIHAGAGGVGILLTQIAKAAGAEVVTTVGTENKAELSRQAGSDHVIVYTDDDFKAVIIDAYGADGIDVVYDGVGAATFEKGLEVLKPRGMMVTFGNASGPVPEISPLELMRRGSLFLTRPTMFDYIESREKLLERASDLFDWIAADQLDVQIGEHYPLEKAADAHRALEGRRTTGKVLLHP